MNPCVSPEELAAWSLGELPEDRIEEVAAHLEACPDCAAAVQGMDTTCDPFVRELRSAGVGGPPEAEPPLPRRVGEYEVLGLLGEGGMGVVYQARHTQLQRLVALKMLSGGEFARGEYRARFRGEAEAVARLQHPNIVQIFEVGEWHAEGSGSSLPYLALEYVEGGSLSDRLAGKPQAPAQAARWLLTLARAVHYAHGQGIVHRDLKPSNVLLTGDGQLKLCDFGVARRLTGADRYTQSGLVVGTAEYMAPEQAAGKGQQAGPAADVYSLGAVLYTMLTGRPPFVGVSLTDVLDQVCTREPVAPRGLQPAVPRDLNTICLKCLHKDPRRRYGSAAALADDLERFLGGRPILARPTGALERGWKWVRRHPREALLGAAVLGVALVGFVLVSWQWQRAEAKAVAEKSARLEAQEARRLAVAEQAKLALNQALGLCDQGEVGRGLVWLVRSLELAEKAEAHDLDTAVRVNLADWQRQLSRPRLTVRHSAPVLDLAFQGDGRTLVSVGKDRHIRFWDTATGQPARPPLAHDWTVWSSGWIGRVVFDPADPDQMVTGDDWGRAYVWDLGAGTGGGKHQEPLLLHPSGHMIWGAAISPDGKRLITACDDGAARVWDVARRAPVGEPLWHSRGTEGVYTLALSPDGRTLVTGGIDRQVVRWDVGEGKRLDSLALPAPVRALAFSRDGRKVLIGTQEGTVHVWQPDAMRVADLPLQGGEVASLAVSPDGTHFAVGTARPGTIRFWDLQTLHPIGQAHKVTIGVRALAFHPDGGTLAAGQDDGTVRLWDVLRPKAVGRPVLFQGPVHGLAFDRAGTRLLVGSSGGAQWFDLAPDPGARPRVWARPLGPLLINTRYEPDRKVLSLDSRRTFNKLNLVEATAASPDSKSVVTAGWAGWEGNGRGRVELWDTATRERVRQTPDQPRPLVGVACSPDFRRLFSWGADSGTATLWDTATLQQARPVCRALKPAIRKAVFHPDGEAVLLACQDGTARLWDLARDKEVNPNCRARHGFPISALAFDLAASPPRVATGCSAGTLRLWDGTTGTLLREIRGAGEIAAVVFTPDGKTLLTASHDGTACFWDAASATQLGPTLRHTDVVVGVAFHPDGRRAVTATRDGQLQMWEVPAAPDQAGVEEIRRRVEEQTGMRLDERGTITTFKRD